MPKDHKLEYIAKSICDLNKMQFIRFIDAGAFKETYLVHGQDIKYALKIFNSENSKERTEREIDAMRRTSCANIAQLFKVGTFVGPEGSFLYLYEKYLAGGTLGELMKKSRIDKERIIAIGSDLINALESTYKENIVHRDIKPDNIMFRDNDGEAVLVDFGLVRHLDATSLTKTSNFRGPGTAFYSAPEQLNNEKNLIDWRTDQFALGITLCEALLGVHPFESGSAIKTIEKIASKTECNNDIRKQLNDFGMAPIIKMLEPHPVKRYRRPDKMKQDWNLLGATT